MDNVMDSPSESECSMDGSGAMLPPTLVSRDQLQKRIESLNQQNRVLKFELETYKIRVKVLQEENRALRQASVIIQAKAEQEEEYISNTLLKKIQALKQEKETLAHHYEREEECLTNDLSRKLDQLRQEKCKLEQTLEQEQECLVNKLMRKIEKLEAETCAKQTNLEQLRREMVELENTLEQEQEALVNKLWKRMDKLEAEKRSLQVQIEQPSSAATPPASGASVAPRTASLDATPPTVVVPIPGVVVPPGVDQAQHLSAHIQTLRSQVARLRHNLLSAQKEASQKMQQFAQEEKSIREENLRLQRKLQLEVERREALCRHLSESESSLEMEEERHYNENVLASLASGGAGGPPMAGRQRTISSPVPPSSGHSPAHSRPLSPSGQRDREQQQPAIGSQAGVGHSPRCFTCGQMLGRRTSERFAKPALPSPSIGLNTSAPNILSSHSANVSAAGGQSPQSAQAQLYHQLHSLQQQHSVGHVGNAIGASGGGANNSSSCSLNSSLSSSFTSNATLPPSSSSNFGIADNSSATGAAFSAGIVQPASPMDTSMCKD